MKRVFILLLTVFAAFFALFAAEKLPPDGRELVEKKYEGWNGVLRVWICEGWQPGSGSLVGWLNRCGSSFEKNHNGVYVQVTAVKAEELRNLSGSELRVPDAVLFAPGILESADDLIPLPAELPGREGVRTSYYAAPVAMGGYAWAIAESESPAVLLPSDDTSLCWPAALLALSAGGNIEESDVGLPGVDLGLEVFAPENPDVIAETATPYTDFVGGRGRAMVATQREIARLKNLSVEGKGPDWTVDARSSITFTDQLLLYGIPECENEDAAQRQALSLEFLMHLLSDECQSALTASGAFPVTDAPAEYAANDPLASLDLALRDPELFTPPVFGNEWRNDARPALAEYTEKGHTAAQAFGRLFGISE